ncbi:MAG: FtsQ-type POTRA domain-containing protein [Propionibacterium sp.]|nr:FtsQ-type POTRA domain-containing protein [Propionibacterium sp.]
MTAKPSSGRTDLGAKLDLRNKTQRRIRRRRGAIVGAVLVVLAVVAWVVFASSALETREVAVTGTQLTTPEEIISTAKVPLGTPLTRIPADSIRQRLLALPEIEDVVLHRNWPHELGIEVIERTMVYQRINGDSYQWVDASGKIFHTATDPVEGILADTASDEQRMLADIAATVGALPADVVEQTSQISAATIDQIVIELADGRQIVWGNSGQAELKAALLPVLLAEPGTVFDVSSPGHPAIR